MINILTEYGHWTYTTYTDSVALSKGCYVARHEVGKGVDHAPVDNSPVSLVASWPSVSDTISISELVSRKVVRTLRVPPDLSMYYIAYINFEGSICARFGENTVVVRNDGRIWKNRQPCSYPERFCTDLHTGEIVTYMSYTALNAHCGREYYIEKDTVHIDTPIYMAYDDLLLMSAGDMIVFGSGDEIAICDLRIGNQVQCGGITRPPLVAAGSSVCSRGLSDYVFAVYNPFLSNLDYETWSLNIHDLRVVGSRPYSIGYIEPYVNHRRQRRVIVA